MSSLLLAASRYHPTATRMIHPGLLPLVASLSTTTTTATTTTTTTNSLSWAPPRVVVPRTRQSKSFRDGNPLVFGGAIAFTESKNHHRGEMEMASLVRVEVETERSNHNNNDKKSSGGRVKGRGKPIIKYPHFYYNDDDDGDESPAPTKTEPLGWGVYNPHSMYRVRILCHAATQPALMRQVSECQTEQEALGRILESKFAMAFQTRMALGLPSKETDTYRIVNGEGDGLSGLAVDVVGHRVAVVMSSAAWCQVHKRVIVERLTLALSRHPVYASTEPPLEIVWRTTPGRLRQDGLDVEHSVVESEETSTHYPEEMVISTESGIRYQSFPYNEQGQKTGVYCDQRENRWNLAMLCRDKRVLDLCCYHGGFALNAKIHGHASQCVGVDSSRDAIDIATANAHLNGCSSTNVTFVRDDISEFMKRAHAQGIEFDVIVLDPPKLAPSASGLDRATRKYQALNRDAIKLISKCDGGLLLTCTCSAAMTQKDGGQHFLGMVQQAANAAKRQISLLRVSGAAPCHTQSPASYPAGTYLTAALFHVSPTNLMS